MKINRKITKKLAMFTIGAMACTTLSSGVLAQPAGNPPGSNTPAATFSSVTVSTATAVAGLFSGAYAAGAILQGLNTSATGGATGVSGVSSGGPGVSGTTSAAGWAGVQGAGGATGNGVYGSTSSASAASYGVSGLATGGRGVFGTSTSNDGVYGTSNSGVGVRAYSAGSNAVYANVANGAGSAIFGFRNNSNGIAAITGQMNAQTVGAGGGYGVLGQSVDTTAAVGDRGTGVYGLANTGTGVLARSVSGTGLSAQSDSTGIAITASNASATNYTGTFSNTSSGPGVSIGVNGGAGLFVGNNSSSNTTATFTNGSTGMAVNAYTLSGGSNPAGRFTKGSNVVDVGGGNNALDVTGTSIFRSPAPYTGSYLQFLNGQDAAANYHVVLRSYNQSGTLQPVWINDVMTNNITTTGVSGGSLNIVSDGSAFFRTTAGGTVNFGAGDTSILLNQAVSNNTANNGGYVYVNDNFRTTGTNDLQGNISNSTGNLSLNDNVDITGTLTATSSFEAPTIRTATDGFRAYSSGYFYAAGFASIDGEIYAKGGISNNDTVVGGGYVYVDDGFRVNSTVTQKLTNTAWTTWSDGRLKDIQKTFDKGLAEIMKIDPIIYKYKKDNGLGIKDDGDHVGIIAQEIQKVFPEAVTTDEKGFLQFTPDSIYWAMLNAIKELNGNDQVLKAKITTLEAQNKALEERLSALEAKLK